MAGHTPGSWRTIKPTSKTGRWHIGTTLPANEQLYVIAKIDNGAPGDTLETEAANARLVAAAPDLLAACKKAVECLRKNYPSQNDLDVALALESVISAAEGEV